MPPFHFPASIHAIFPLLQLGRGAGARVGEGSSIKAGRAGKESHKRDRSEVSEGQGSQDVGQGACLPHLPLPG